MRWNTLGWWLRTSGAVRGRGMRASRIAGHRLEGRVVDRAAVRGTRSTSARARRSSGSAPRRSSPSGREQRVGRELVEDEDHHRRGLRGNRSVGPVVTQRVADRGDRGDQQEEQHNGRRAHSPKCKETRRTGGRTGRFRSASREQQQTLARGDLEHLDLVSPLAQRGLRHVEREVFDGVAGEMNERPTASTRPLTATARSRLAPARPPRRSPAICAGTTPDARRTCAKSWSCTIDERAPLPPATRARLSVARPTSERLGPMPVNNVASSPEPKLAQAPAYHHAPPRLPAPAGDADHRGEVAHRQRDPTPPTRLRGRRPRRRRRGSRARSRARRPSSRRRRGCARRRRSLARAPGPGA